MYAYSLMLLNIVEDEVITKKKGGPKPEMAIKPTC